MRIALDFDKTYDKAPGFWDDFIANSRESGFEVILATYRHPTEDWDPLMDDLDIPLYFTDGKAKRPFLEAQGIIVDIWIDDNPHSIIEDSAWAPHSPELAAWRKLNKERIDIEAGIEGVAL